MSTRRAATNATSPGSLWLATTSKIASVWYAEEEIVSLLRSVGYSDVRIEPPAWTRGEGWYFAVSASA